MSLHLLFICPTIGNPFMNKPGMISQCMDMSVERKRSAILILLILKVILNQTCKMLSGFRPSNVSILVFSVCIRLNNFRVSPVWLNKIFQNLIGKGDTQFSHFHDILNLIRSVDDEYNGSLPPLFRVI